MDKNNTVISIGVSEGEARFIQQALGRIEVPVIGHKRDAIMALIQRIEDAISLSNKGDAE